MRTKLALTGKSKSEIVAATAPALDKKELPRSMLDRCAT